MKLTFSPASPFARKVRIAAIELGLIDKIEFVPATVVPGTAQRRIFADINPLKKLPALILDNGEHHARFLCDRRISRRTRRRRKTHSGIRPGAVEGQERPFAAAGHARFDAAVPLRENGAAEGTALAGMGGRSLEAGLEWHGDVSRSSPDVLARPLDIAQIGLVCVLGYADFRFADCGWRKSVSETRRLP